MTSDDPTDPVAGEATKPTIPAAEAVRALEAVRRGAMDRRRFLMTGSAVLAGTALAGFGPVSGWRSGAARFGSEAQAAPTGGPSGLGADGALAPPGTVGLMDETVYQARIDDYLAHATAQFNPGNANNVSAHLTRAHRDPGYTFPVGDVTVETLADNFQKIDEWRDTRDFDLMYLIWMMHLGAGDTATTRIDPAVIEAIETRLLHNRYRYDDPLPDDRIDNLWYWSENHIIINLAIEYLAGRRLPDHTFVITGLTGTQHAERARPGILEWIHERVELGFFEWHSNVYMLKNVTPLLMLAELTDDAEITRASAIGLDLCLLDMAGHQHRGTYTAPRGRTYKKDKTSSLDEDTFETAKFVFDDTDHDYPSRSNSGPIFLSGAHRYRPPQLLLDMARDRSEHVVTERHGVHFDTSGPLVDDPVAPYGRDFEDRANLPFWWSLGALGMWPVTRAGVAAADEFRLWETELFSDINLIAMLNGHDAERIRAWLHPRSAAINFGFLGEANTYAYRHPKVALASVLDHRAGEMRDQVHSWQAAIDEHAMVFTNHPVTDVAESTDWDVDGRPGYWTGEASMPRSAQHRRTAVHLYLPAWDEATDVLVWAVYGYRPFTHAYVPQDHFDEVRQVGHWTVAAKGGAYIALWSWRAPSWRVHDPATVATRGMVQPFDLVAEGGADNVWLVEVGTDDDGDLDTFIGRLTSHDPVVQRDDTGFAVNWESPSSGSIEFSSNGPFLVAGTERPLGDHPRHESPWGRVEHLATAYQLGSGPSAWAVDATDWTRIPGPAGGPTDPGPDPDPDPTDPDPDPTDPDPDPTDPAPDPADPDGGGDGGPPTSGGPSASDTSSSSRPGRARPAEPRRGRPRYTG